MHMRVTFDTNTVDKAVRPERSPKDSDQPLYFKVHEALKCGLIRGFVCETIVTLEGIQNTDRVTVFGSTTLFVDLREAGNSVQINMKAMQPARQALPEENARRLRAALALGVRVLAAPRIANVRIEDPDKKIYVQQDRAELAVRIDRCHDAARDIELRGCGTEPAKRVAAKIARRLNVTELWYKSLAKADAAEEQEFARAVREWADSDTAAAHIGYQNDILCTGDTGKAGDSIFSEQNRAWLTEAYGVKFATINELAAMIDKKRKAVLSQSVPDSGYDDSD
jgi:hypothetical protein